MKKLFLIIFLFPLITFGQAQLELPYSVKVLNPKPLDAYYFNTSFAPYANTAEVISQVTAAVRYRGQTFNVSGTEYCFCAGIADGDLAQKFQVPAIANDNFAFGSGTGIKQSSIQYTGNGNGLVIMTQSPPTITDPSNFINNVYVFGELMTLIGNPTNGGTITDAAMFGISHNIGDGVNAFSGSGGLTYGQNNHNYGLAGFVGGSLAEIQNSGETVGNLFSNGGIAIGLSFPGASGNTDRYVTSWANAINISSNTLAQTIGNGALAPLSLIIGGYDHHIPHTADRSGILGGHGIVARKHATDQIYVPNFNIVTKPQPLDTAMQVLVRVHGDTGRVAFRHASTFGSPPTGTGGTFQFNDGSGGLAATETSTGGTYTGRLTYDNTLGFTTDQKNTGTNSTSFYTLSYPGGVHYRQGISPVINSYTLSPTSAAQDVSDGTTKFIQSYGAGTTIEVGGGGNGSVTNTYTNSGMSLVRNTTTSPTTFTFHAANGISGSTAGQDFTLNAGDGLASGNTNGGNVNIVAGQSNGAGVPGSISLQLPVNGKFVISNLSTSDPGSAGAWYEYAGIPLISGDEQKAIATLDFPNTSAGTSSDLTVTVTGVLLANANPILLGVPNGSVNANSCYTAWISADNTVTVRFNNYSSGAINPASGSFSVRLFPN